MNFKRLIAAAALLTAVAGSAHATRNPEPPPSGITVHLFGPNGVFSDLPGNGAPPSATPRNGVDSTDNPSWHAVVHQMFVVGDPNDPPKRASGRPGERQATPAGQ